MPARKMVSRSGSARHRGMHLMACGHQHTNKKNQIGHLQRSRKLGAKAESTVPIVHVQYDPVSHPVCVTNTSSMSS